MGAVVTTSSCLKEFLSHTATQTQSRMLRRDSCDVRVWPVLMTFDSAVTNKLGPA